MFAASSPAAANAMAFHEDDLLGTDYIAAAVAILKPTVVRVRRERPASSNRASPEELANRRRSGLRHVRRAPSSCVAPAGVGRCSDRSYTGDRRSNTCIPPSERATLVDQPYYPIVNAADAT
jgi:hypothetical protein